MDIFNGNQRLEQFVYYGLDWGTFVRHDTDEPIMPFMFFIADGKIQMHQVLAGAQDPLAFAIQGLKAYDKPFDQVIIGLEGYAGEGSDRADAIIVQGFDVTQDKGVVLCQRFNPAENGGFRKIGRFAYLGNPDLPIPKRDQAPQYDAEEAGSTGIAVTGKDDNLISYMPNFVHKNVSMIGMSIKQYLRSKFSDEKRASASGSFELMILEDEAHAMELLRFIVMNAVNEELNSDAVQAWQKSTQRKITVVCQYGVGTAKKVIFETSIEAPADVNKTSDDKVEVHDYKTFTLPELDKEFYRIAAIPNAHTNITALTLMTELLMEYDARKVENPQKRQADEPKRPWWQFWK